MPVCRHVGGTVDLDDLRGAVGRRRPVDAPTVGERERLGRRDLGDDTGRLVGAGEAEFDVRVQAVDPQTHAQAHRIG